MRDQQKNAGFRVAALAATLASMLAACGGGSASSTPTVTTTTSSVPSETAATEPATPPATTTDPTAEATPSVDSAVAQATADILVTYQAWWDAWVQYLADPTNEPPELSYNSQDKALGGVRDAADRYAFNGIVNTGAPVISPVVSDVSFEASGSATIRDCVDVTNWQPVYAATGESALAPDQPTRVVVVSTAFIYADRWVIGDATMDRETSC